MEIKQLKLNGTAFYPKVGIDSIVNAAGQASAVDTVVTENSSNLVTSGAVYNAIQEGGGSETVVWDDITNKPDFKTVATSGSYNDLTNKPIIPTKTSQLTNDSSFVNDYQLSGKQNTLVSGTNIKTVNGNSLLGSGNIEIGGSGTIDTEMSDSSTNAVQNNVITQNILSVTPIVKSESNFGSSCIQVVNQLRISGTQINPWKKEGQDTFNPALIEFTVAVVDINETTRSLNKRTFSYIISPGEGTDPVVSERVHDYQTLVDKFVNDLCNYFPAFSNGGSNSMIIRESREGDRAYVDLAVNVTSTPSTSKHFQIVLSSFELAGYDTVGKDNKVISLGLTSSSTESEWNSDIFYKTMSISKGSLGTIVTNPQTMWFNTTINHLMMLDGQGRIYDCTTGSKFTFAPNYQQS